MNYEFLISTWVRFLHDFKNDDGLFVPANTIGVIVSRSYLSFPSKFKIAYKVSVPCTIPDSYLIESVPEKILEKYDRIAAGNPKLGDIRYYNAWLRNKAEKEISDMKVTIDNDSVLRMFGVSASIFANTCPMPMRICYDGLTTVVFWEDGTVTSVRCSEEDKDKFSEYSGFTAALAKKMYGTHSDVVHLIEKKRAKPGRPITPPEKWKKMQARKKEG